jgi:hypothetical protein
MESMTTFPPDNGAVFTRIFDAERSSLKRRLADTTYIVIGVPTPGSDAVISLDVHI